MRNLRERAAIAIVYIIILLFILSIVYPVSSEDIKIFKGKEYYFIKNGNLTISQIIYAVNKGPYPISNLILNYKISNASSIISAGTEDLKTVIGNVTENISFIINLSELIKNKNLTSLIFKSQLLSLNFSISGLYALGFVTFSMTSGFPLIWNRIVYYHFLLPEIVQNESNVTISVPLQVNISSLLRNNLKILSEMYLNGTQIKSSYISIVPGINYTTELNFTFPSSYKEFIYQNFDHFYFLNYMILFNRTLFIGEIR